MPAPQSHLSHSSPPAVLSQKQQRQQPHQQQQSQKPAPPSHQNSLSVYHRGVATSATQQILSPPQHPLHRALPHQAPTQLFTLQQPQLHQQQSGGAGNQFAIPPSPAPSSSYPLRSSPSSDEDSAYSSMKEDTPPTVFPSTSDALSPPGTFSATPTHHFIPPQLPLSAIPDLQAIKLFLDTTLKFAGDLQFRILGVPTQNARSRVETQIKICLQLVSMPKGEKVSHWSYLKLPEHAVTRDKVKRGVVQDFLQLPPNSVLTLEARVVCASDPTRTVQLCTSCAQRERKRSRKTAEEDAEDFPGQQIDRTLLFSCPGHVDFSSGDTILPTRIACYSRHQNEKIGFCVYFVGRDASGNAVATGLTPPVLITDDHKAGKPKAQKRTRDDRQMALEGLFSDFATSPLNAETPSLTSGLTTQVPPTTASPAPTTPTPTIHRIIPSSGPMTGGIEVTLLGSNLHQNLTVLFGGVPAASSHSWGSGSTLVCILPPSSTPGPVPVTFKEHPLTSITAIGEVVVFTYRDETERALMELALQVVGLKMTGRLEDARDVAMRIVSDTANGGVGSGTASLNGKFSETLEVESNESAQPSHLDVRTKTGRHSLLHLACMMKMTALVKYLVGCDDIDLDARDAWGFTPLHYAAWSGNRGLCVQLVQAGASLLLSSRDGITVGHLAIKAGMNLVELVRTCFPAPGLPLVNQRSMSLTLVRVEENDDEALSYDAEYEFDDDEEETEAFKFTPFFGQIAGDKSHMSELRLVDEPQVANVVSAKTIVSRDAVASRPMRSVSSNVLSSYHSSPFATPLKPPTTESGSIRRSGSLPLFPDPAHELLSAVLEAAKPVNFAEFSNLKQLRNESKTGVSDMGSESDKKVSSSKKAHGSWLPIGPYMAIPQLLFAFPYMLPALPSVSDFASVSVPGMKLLTDLLSFVTDVVLRQGTAERGSSLDFEKSPSQPTSPLTTANHPLSTPVSPLLTADAILGTAPLPPLLDLSLSRSSTLAGSVDPTSSDSRASLDTLHSDDPIDDLLPPPPASFLATLPPCTCPPPSASDQHATTSTSDTSCRHHALLRAHAESQKRKRDRAVALFWAPLLLLMVALALFRVFVSNEEMDRIVDRVVVVNVEVVAYVRDTVRGLRHGAAGFGGGGDTGVGVVGDGHRWWQGGGGLDGSWWGIGGGGPAAVGVVG
ncbi:hypothetical protein DFJ73DRAFT_648092 [Zopfochytrium polystomum]|nr:hypothetical protein DFJ73DRAFT_648092 [Zopfochytrium polystomum]